MKMETWWWDQTRNHRWDHRIEIDRWCCLQLDEPNPNWVWNGLRLNKRARCLSKQGWRRRKWWSPRWQQKPMPVHTTSKKKISDMRWAVRVFDAERRGKDCNEQTRRRDDLFVLLYDLDFRDLVKEQKLSVPKGLSAKVYYFLADLRYNLPRNRKNDLAECHKFGSNDIKDMSGDPGDLM